MSGETYAESLEMWKAKGGSTPRPLKCVDCETHEELEYGLCTTCLDKIRLPYVEDAEENLGIEIINAMKTVCQLAHIGLRSRSRYRSRILQEIINISEIPPEFDI